MAEDFEKYLNELDGITEGILSKIGDAAKGFIKGLAGEPHTEKDSDEEKSKKLNKTSAIYAANGASAHMTGAINKKFKKGEPFFIGNNKILEISDELLPLLFKYDASGNYFLTYDFEYDKYKLRWLLDGVYEAKSLSLSKISTGGPIKGRDISFVGVWKSGEFKGILSSNSIITGGYIVDGIFASNADGFKIPPYNFISKGYSVFGNKIMGLPIVEQNKKYNSISIYQVKPGDQIKIIDNNDAEHVLKIEKSMNISTTDIVINGTVVNWDSYNRSRSNFMKSVIKVGEKFSIPGIINIEDGIQSIEVKAPQYQKKESNLDNNKDSQTIDSKFPNPVKGWGSTVPGGYKIDETALEDEEIRKKYERFKKDAESGSFERYLNFLKKLISQGRVDGFGNYPSLSYLWKEKGKKYLEKDEKRDATLKYFSDFSENIIDNFKSEKVQKYYENKMAEFLGFIQQKSKSKTAKFSKQNFLSSVGKALDESKSSIKEMIIKNLKN
jgi:hypothetical protein